MKITVVTPTADRPVAFALCERWMARQTRQPDEWVVADGGFAPARCTLGQIHVHAPLPAGAMNFTNNLLNGIARATGEAIVWCEDDDYYAPDHLECMAAALEARPLVGSEDVQHYYNVAHRAWRRFNNTGASLCQTGMRREMWPAFEAIVRQCLARGAHGTDTYFWRSVPREQWGLLGRMTVLGLKGLPGCAGLGIGHRPNGHQWTADPDLAQLREWIGADADLYAGYQRQPVAA